MLEHKKLKVKTKQTPKLQDYDHFPPIFLKLSVSTSIKQLSRFHIQQIMIKELQNMEVLILIQVSLFTKDGADPRVHTSQDTGTKYSKQDGISDLETVLEVQGQEKAENAFLVVITTLNYLEKKLTKDIEDPNRINYNHSQETYFCPKIL